MFSLHVDFEEACGFYNRSNGGVRQKLKTGSQCESVLLRCLTPARLIRMKQITSDEALSNQLLRLYHKSPSGLRRVTAIIKIIRKDSKVSSFCAYLLTNTSALFAILWYPM